MTPHATSSRLARANIQGGQEADFNEAVCGGGPESAFRLVAERHERLRRLLAMHAPDIVVGNEMRMMGAAVHALLERGLAEQIQSAIVPVPRAKKSHHCHVKAPKQIHQIGDRG